MISREMLIELFKKRLNELAAENGLKPEEEKRILSVFEKALESPFMDEHRIFPELIGGESV